MAPNKTSNVALPTGVGIAWRHFWLTKAMIDSGTPNSEKISRHNTTVRMSPARRLEKLHRMRATLIPPRSWLDK
jgi:hypothetical protein